MDVRASSNPQSNRNPNFRQSCPVSSFDTQRSGLDNKPPHFARHSVTAPVGKSAGVTRLPSVRDTDLRQQALAEVQQGHYEIALAVFNHLLDLNPNNAVDYNNRGLVHFQNGQLEEALADYNRALDLNPRLANVYNNRANYYAAQGQLAAAIADYDNAIDLNPGNLRAWINQGITFRDLELYERAIENFDLALNLSQSALEPYDSLKPNSLVGHIYGERGRTHHLLGDWNWAIADYQRALVTLADHIPGTLDSSSRLRSQIEKWLSELLSPLGL